MTNSFENQIENLSAASNNQIEESIKVTRLVETTIQTLIDKANEAQQQSKSFINGARAETPYFLLSRNQGMAQDDDPTGPDHFIRGPNLVLEKIELVEVSTPWASRSADAQDILRLIGHEFADHIDESFWIWRCSWITNNAESPHTIYQRVTRSSVMTVGAVTKLESGSVTGGFCEGITNDWGVTGQTVARKNQDYHNFHPVRTSGSGSFLMAMVGAVAGIVDIENNDWTMFHDPKKG